MDEYKMEINTGLLLFVIAAQISRMIREWRESSCHVIRINETDGEPSNNQESDSADR